MAALTHVHPCSWRWGRLTRSRWVEYEGGRAEPPSPWPCSPPKSVVSSAENAGWVDAAACQMRGPDLLGLGFLPVRSSHRARLPQRLGRPCPSLVFSPPPPRLSRLHRLWVVCGRWSAGQKEPHLLGARG